MILRLSNVPLQNMIISGVFPIFFVWFCVIDTQCYAGDGNSLSLHYVKYILCTVLCIGSPFLPVAKFLSTGKYENMDFWEWTEYCFSSVYQRIYSIDIKFNRLENLLKSRTFKTFENRISPSAIRVQFWRVWSWEARRNKVESGCWNVWKDKS